MNRERIVEAVANIEREFNELASDAISNDTLTVWNRQLEQLRNHAAAAGLPTTKITQLKLRVTARLSGDEPVRPGPVARERILERHPRQLEREITKPTGDTRKAIDDLFGK